jgi:predicted Zn-ribbon and HTH transcriptional regulator
LLSETALVAEARCRACGEEVEEDELDWEGVCPGCVDVSRFTGYAPESDEPHADDVDEDLQTCPRCGQSTHRLLGVTHNTGGTRDVCPECRSEALAGDRSFWHWFHKE